MQVNVQDLTVEGCLHFIPGDLRGQKGPCGLGVTVPHGDPIINEFSRFLGTEWSGQGLQCQRSEDPIQRKTNTS